MNHTINFLKSPEKQDSTAQVGLTSDRNSKHRYILGMRVDVTSYSEATRKVIRWAKAKESRYVCAANVHMTMEAFDHPAFSQVVNRAALVTPDGMPLVLALQALAAKDASRVCGPTLTLDVCEAAAQEGVGVALYGGTPDSLAAFTAFLRDRFPKIKVVCQISPPFRPLTPSEDEEYTQQIVESGAGVVLVGIGCPKQEFWMAAHQGRIPAVMLGIGAAFDFHSGRVKRAPVWMQNACLEWFYRLMQEPKRLWKRYTVHNFRFILLFFSQWFKYSSPV